MQSIFEVEAPEILEIALKVVAALLLAGCSKAFCVAISGRVISLTHHETLSELAT
jgi:hypothetical protein